MALREGAPQDWTPNVSVEQRAQHNANKAQQGGRQMHPPIRDKDGNLQPHSPWMAHFILEDHGDNRKGTEVQITHVLAHRYLNYAVDTSNMHVTYGEARKSTYRLQVTPKAQCTRCTPGHDTRTCQPPSGTQTRPGTNPSIGGECPVRASNPWGAAPPAPAATCPPPTS